MYKKGKTLAFKTKAYKFVWHEDIFFNSKYFGMYF